MIKPKRGESSGHATIQDVVPIVATEVDVKCNLFVFRQWGPADPCVVKPAPVPAVYPNGLVKKVSGVLEHVHRVRVKPEFTAARTVKVRFVRAEIRPAPQLGPDV